MEKLKISSKYKLSISSCVGRNIIRFPEIFSQTDTISGYFKSSSNAKENISSFDVIIGHQKHGAKNFSNYILQRKAEIKSNSGSESDVLRFERELSDEANLFRIQRSEGAYLSEVDFSRGDNIVTVRVKSYENQFLEAENLLVKFVSDFVVTDQNKAAGFCLGSLTILGDFVEESGTYFWQDGEGNTIDIKIDPFGSQDSIPLLRRMSGPDSLLSMFHIGHTVLRSGERSVAGVRAQEWLGWTSFNGAGGDATFKFTLETLAPADAEKKSKIVVTYDSAQTLADGRRTQTNLSDKEAIAMWDEIIDSIHAAN